MRGLNKLEYIKILVRYRNTAEMVRSITKWRVKGKTCIYLHISIESCLTNMGTRSSCASPKLSKCNSQLCIKFISWLQANPIERQVIVQGVLRNLKDHGHQVLKFHNTPNQSIPAKWFWREIRIIQCFCAIVICKIKDEILHPPFTLVNLHICL